MVASAWSMTPLFAGSHWLRPAATLVAVVFASGLVGRRWLPHRWQTGALQLVVLVLSIGWLFPGAVGSAWSQPTSTLVFGVPTPATVSAWADLLSEAFGDLRSHPPPVPVSPGVIFLLTVSIGVLAWVADLLGATLRMPALAGLPLLAPYLTVIANTDGTQPWPYFVAPTVAWLLLLAQAQRQPPPARHAWTGALVTGAIAVTVAVLAASVLPMGSARQFTDSLLRGGAVGSGRVGFSTDLDLRAALRATDHSPVLRYTTDVPSPAPLRVLVAEEFTGTGWTQQKPAAAPSSAPHPPRSGYEGIVRTEQRHLTVEHTSLTAPHVAAPYGVVGGSMTGAHWAVDARTGLVVADRTPVTYRLDFLQPQPSDEALSTATTTPRYGVGARVGVGAATLAVSREDADLLGQALTDVVPPGTSPYQSALLLQRWLRSAEFTYSLDGVPEPSESDAGDAPNLLGAFLRERRGYCTHFATTMVLGARLQGIPARMAYGFLPGTPVGHGYEVRQSDAHAWPELYFPQTGWLAFEPTPAQRSGAGPAYAQDRNAQPEPSPSATAEEPAPSPSAEPEADSGDLQVGSVDQATQTGDGSSAWWVVWLALGGVAVVLGTGPVAAWHVRRRDLAAAAGPAARAEVEWEHLTSALADLGFTEPTGGTLPDHAAHYAEVTGLDAAERGAMGEVVAVVEDARYAPPGTPLPDIAAPAAVVRRAARSNVSWGRRWRARLWPRHIVTRGSQRRTRAPKRPRSVVKR